MEESNFPLFLLSLASELGNNEKPPDSRKLAGLILKNALDAKEEPRKIQLTNQWIALDQQVKTQIKHLVLSTLGSPVKEARRTASRVIGKIAAIELPRNQWTELIGVLLGNMTSNPTDNLKQATLEALGYICEDINPSILESRSNEILTAVVQGMRKEELNNEVKLAATNALYNSLEFARNNFENETERNYIMQVCCEASVSPDVKVRVAAYECLVKIVSLYYDKMAPYMQTLFNLTVDAIKIAPEPVAQQAVEFWSTVCDEEIELNQEAEEAEEMQEQVDRTSQNYIKQALPLLVPLILQTLTRQEEGQDEDTWNVSMAAGTCLDLIANTVGDDVVQYIMTFVQQNIMSADWHHREAAILSFGSIMQGPSKTVLQPLCTQALPVLVTAMQDQNVLVRDTTAWTIGRICDFHPNAVDKDHLPALMMEVFIKGLRDVPRVAGNICWAIHNLAQSYEAEEQTPTNDLSPFFLGLVQQLFAVTEREDAAEANLRTSAYEAINVLIQNSATDVFPALQQIVPVVLDKLQKTFSIPIVSHDDKEEQSELQALLCGVLQAIIHKMGKQFDTAAADQAMTLFLQVFSTRSASVHEEALMAVGALANAQEGAFERYMGAFKDYLNLGLRNWEEYQVCSVAVGVVGDVCRALEKKITPYCDEIVTLLLHNLQNAQLNRNVKPTIISCFGDIALAICGNFEKYLHVVCSMLQQASQTRVEQDDYDLLEYINQLRESIFEAYTGILQGLKTDNRAEVFLPYVDPLLSFIQVVSQDSNRYESVTRACVGVIGDLASALKGHVSNHMKQDYVKNIVKECTKSSDNQTAETAKWAREMIKAVGG